MTSIAKLTLDGYCNYGNLLQNYALQQVLLRYVDHVDTIWHTEGADIPRDWGYLHLTWKSIVKFIINWKGFRDRTKANRSWDLIRQGKLRDWCNRYIHERYNVKNLSDIADEYDAFVIGSDQVWNPFFEDVNLMFLQFAPQGKRISYAASISCPDIPQDKKEIYRQGLLGMQAISVREHQGADMVKMFTGREVPVHVDPTLLLSPDEWRQVSRQPVWYHGQDYILTYFLGPEPVEVKNILEKLDMPVVNMLDKNNYDYYVTGVDEFIWAVEHAKLIYTDSFHGSVFSILFQRPFAVCNRQADNAKDQVMNKMGSRIDTLLNYFHLESRRSTRANGYQVDHLLDMQYGDTNAVIAREIQRTDQYLRKALTNCIQSGGWLCSK